MTREERQRAGGLGKRGQQEGESTDEKISDFLHCMSRVGRMRS
jgi:hypothetical protein